MTAETILMKLLAIPESERDAFEDTLKTCPDDMLELSLIQLSQVQEDPDFDAGLEDYAGTFFPQTLGKFASEAAA